MSTSKTRTVLPPLTVTAEALPPSMVSPRGSLAVGKAPSCGERMMVAEGEPSSKTIVSLPIPAAQSGEPAWLFWFAFTIASRSEHMPFGCCSSAAVSTTIWPGVCASSNAPLSHRGPWGRCCPRWSVVMSVPQPIAPGGIASTAGLAARTATVWVGPPLLCNPWGSRRGFAFDNEWLALLKPHVVPSSMSYPPSAIVPEQLPP